MVDGSVDTAATFKINEVFGGKPDEPNTRVESQLTSKNVDVSLDKNESV